MNNRFAKLRSMCLAFLLIIAIFCGCASFGGISAEEYFTIGMAYFEMGKFADAERWLNRARAKDRTMSASEYNLGRIAFETGRFDEAARYFESVLKRDPGNVLALRAAAYTHIRNGNIEKALELYNRLLVLVPESADDGYNHALVLFALEKYAEAEQVLANYEFALLENNDVLLLFARAQRKQNKVEALDSFAKWLANNNDAKVRFEYAQFLESLEHYARALEEYRTALAGLPSGSTDPTRPELRFIIARLLLVADSGSAGGLDELKGAVADGFDDLEAIEGLLSNNKISAANRGEIRTILAATRRTVEAAKAAEAAAENEADAEDDAEEEGDLAENADGEQTE